MKDLKLTSARHQLPHDKDKEFILKSFKKANAIINSWTTVCISHCQQ